VYGNNECDCRTGYGGSQCERCDADDTCPDIVGPGGIKYRQVCSRNLVEANSSLQCDIMSSNLGGFLKNTMHDYIDWSTWDFKFDISRSRSIDMQLWKPSEYYIDYYSYLESPLLLEANLTGCAPAESIDCATVGSQLVKAGDTDPWKSSNTTLCQQWKCTSTQVTCPVGNYRWDNACPLTKAIFGQAVTVVCNIIPMSNATRSTQYHCALLIGGATSGGLHTATLACGVGACSDSGDPPYIPPAAPSTFCQDHSWVCDPKTVYVFVMVLPALLLFLFLMRCYCKSKAPKNLEHNLQYMVAVNNVSSYQPPALADAEDTEAGRVGDDQWPASSSSTSPTQCKRSVGEDEVWMFFEDVKFDLHNDNQDRSILKGVTGVAPAAVTAILGPSGCGKTTFIDILSARKNTGTLRGHVGFRGYAHPPPEHRRKLLGYVMQDDVLPGTCTVAEHLHFHAALRLSSLSQAERNERVEETMAALGLTKIQNSRIGTQFSRGLSGGEKRRVSIAVELLANLPVIIMDEPTSGLDSASAEDVVNALTAVAKSGVGVILSIHQPSSELFSRFDRLIVLSSHGYTLYAGPRQDATEHFAAQGHVCPADYNPAEFLLLVASKASLSAEQKLAAAFASSAIAEEERALLQICKGSVATPDSFVASGSASLCRQYLALARRGFTTSFRHPLLIGANFVAAVVMAVMVGGIYYQVTLDLPGATNRGGVLFFSLTFFMLTSLVSLGVWQEERLLYLRESSSGCYSAGSYLLAKLSSDIVPLRVFPVCVYALIAYPLVGLQMADSTLEHLSTFLIVLILFNVCTSTVFTAIAIACKRAAVAMLMGTLVALLALLLSGFTANKTGMPSYIAWLLDLSFTHAGWEALMINEFSGLTFKLTGQTADQSGIFSGAFILGKFGINFATCNDKDAYHINQATKNKDIASLVGLTLLFMGISYALLRFFVKERR